jgi:hypothetical protein
MPDGHLTFRQLTMTNAARVLKTLANQPVLASTVRPVYVSQSSLDKPSKVCKHESGLEGELMIARFWVNGINLLQGAKC